MNYSANNVLPRGAAFLDAVARTESTCFELTSSEIPVLGISTPACFAAMGDVLSSLYSEAACLHGCKGGDHFYQRLTARVVSHSLASVRLAMAGYYDESLALTRSIGEIANLLFLFAAKPSEVEVWRNSDDASRKKYFKPVDVRMKIEGLGLKPPVEKEHYSLLCETGVHLVPSVSPQSFNEHSRPSLGASFQFEGLMFTLNELAVVVAEAAACLSIFPESEARRLSLQCEAQILLNVSGQLDLSYRRASISGNNT